MCIVPWQINKTGYLLDLCLRNGLLLNRYCKSSIFAKGDLQMRYMRTQYLKENSRPLIFHMQILRSDLSEGNENQNQIQDRNRIFTKSLMFSQLGNSYCAKVQTTSAFLFPPPAPVPATCIKTAFLRSVRSGKLVRDLNSQYLVQCWAAFWKL